MKLHTEREYLNQIQQFAFRLRKMYSTDYNLFLQINEVIPFSVHINRRDSLDITYANNQLLNRGKEMEKLVEYGALYLSKISNPILLEKAKQKASAFNMLNDNNSICCYLQKLNVESNKEEYLYSNKLILNDNLYFNLSSFTEDLGLIGKIFENVFEPLNDSQVVWSRFQSLTKQEKRILGMISKGLKQKEMAECLFISQNTVRTHFKNIHKKLGTNKKSNLIRLGIILGVD